MSTKNLPETHCTLDEFELSHLTVNKVKTESVWAKFI